MSVFFCVAYVVTHPWFVSPHTLSLECVWSWRGGKCVGKNTYLSVYNSVVAYSCFALFLFASCRSHRAEELRNIYQEDIHYFVQHGSSLLKKLHKTRPASQNSEQVGQSCFDATAVLFL